MLFEYQYIFFSRITLNYIGDIRSSEHLKFSFFSLYKNAKYSTLDTNSLSQALEVCVCVCILQLILSRVAGGIYRLDVYLNGSANVIFFTNEHISLCYMISNCCAEKRIIDNSIKRKGV